LEHLFIYFFLTNVFIFLFFAFCCYIKRSVTFSLSQTPLQRRIMCRYTHSGKNIKVFRILEEEKKIDVLIWPCTRFFYEKKKKLDYHFFLYFFWEKRELIPILAQSCRIFIIISHKGLYDDLISLFYSYNFLLIIIHKLFIIWISHLCFCLWARNDDYCWGQ
jgi:hypothetical protein